MQMQYRRLGNTGLKISSLGLGSWITFGLQIGDHMAEELMQFAYSNGMNFFDNAEAYAQGNSEVVMGSILSKKRWKRSSYILSSKVFWGGDAATQTGLSRKHIFDACHSSLKRLRTDYIDLYYCHRPDLDTPIVETVEAMSDLVRQGKIRYWGTSEWTARDIALAHAAAYKNNLVAPVVEQPQYNIFHRERVEVEYSRLYEECGLGVTIWSPLASGLLSGKYCEKTPGGTRISLQGYEWLKEKFQGEDFDQKVEMVRQLSSLAESLGMSMPCLGLAWCLKNANVSSVILGASRLEQLQENVNAISYIDYMTDEVMASIDQIVGNKPQPEERF